MDSERWHRLSDLFERALDVSVAQRETWIADNCGGDISLVGELKRMLAADIDAQCDEFLESPIASPDMSQFHDDSDATDYPPGTRLFGPYRLLRLIGQGGMGEVHLAERGDGAFEQRVALKLLPHPTPGLIQRFRQERQILARLEHPQIARLLDGGVGENNIPYFAMEYVEGVPVTKYVTTQKLDISTTLRLFIRICDAVQYAHRNLVVHRDLKPSNILVTADGTPKLLDFGIAKVLQATGETDATQTAARVFTPDYAAPEQIRGETMTTATDVYALGVILYELLAGTRPYRLGVRNSSLEQAILQVEPSPPSSAVGKSLGNARQRRNQLHGDLDRIALTALAKEPERRYSSPEMLAADIRRHLEGRPIAARADSATYRMRKFVRRNRIGVAAAGAIGMALIAATGVSLHQATIAHEQAARADAVSGFLETIFRSIDPANAKGRDVSAVELVDAGAARVDRDLAAQPAAAAQLHATLGETYFALGDYAKAEKQYRAALDLFQPDQTVAAIGIQARLADLRMRSGSAVEAQEILDRAQTRARRDAPQDAALADTLLGLRANFAEQRGDNAIALQLGEQRWRLLAARLGDDAAATLDAEQAYASYLSGASRHADAVERQSHVVARRRLQSSADTPELADALHNLGIFQSYLVQPDATLASFEEALRIRRKVLPANHPEIARSINETAEQLLAVGKPAQALAMRPEALSIVRAQKQPDLLLLATVLNNWGVNCHYAGDDECAVARIREALELWQSMFAPEHTYVLTARSSLAALLTAKGELKAAETQLREVQAAREKDIADRGDSEDKADALHHTRELLAMNLYYQRRPNEALTLAQTNFANVERRFAAPKIDHMEALSVLARIEAYAGNSEQASVHARAALDECDRLKVGEIEHRAWLNFVMAFSALQAHHDKEAEAAARNAVDIFTRTQGPEHPKTAEARGLLGRALAQLHRQDEARSELDSAIAVLSTKQPWQPALDDLRAARASL
jgi:eukaryotic-like serine/threonine-protein kinase